MLTNKKALFKSEIHARIVCHMYVHAVERKTCNVYCVDCGVRSKLGRQQAADSLQNIEVEQILRCVTSIAVIILIISVDRCAVRYKTSFLFRQNMMKFGGSFQHYSVFIRAHFPSVFIQSYNETFGPGELNGRKCNIIRICFLVESFILCAHTTQSQS